ncbi:MAG: wax ester/triacylglycerol synthase domain-containing protein [Motiliproteus sp.]
MLGTLNLDALPFISDDVGGQRMDTFVMIYDQRGLTDGPLRFKQVLTRIKTEVRHYPQFRQLFRPSVLPLGAQCWVDDEAFDVEFHVRHIALPKPGDWRQFCIQVARLHSRPLDQTRPLWEINVVEGLDNIPWLGEGHFALVCKVHRGLMESTHEQAQDLIWTLHDEVEFAVDSAPASKVNVALPFADLLRDGCDRLLRPLGGPLELALGAARSVSSRLMPAVGFYTHALLGKGSMPFTRFNTDISSFRVWESCYLSAGTLARLQQYYPGVSESDLILAQIAGALRLYLNDKTELGGRDLWALAPVQPADADAQTLTFSVVNLATGVEDPAERLLSISRWRQQNPPVEAMIVEAPLRSPLRRMTHTNDLLQRIQGTQSGRITANTALITLPDERHSLSLLGAPLVYLSGVPEVSNGLGLVHLASRYGDHLTLTVTSCREMLPDPAFYRECLYQSLQEMLGTASQSPEELSL